MNIEKSESSQNNSTFNEPYSAFNKEDFVNPELAEELICIICSYIPHLSIAVQHKCGAVFCLLCIEKWLTEKENCPVCREEWKEGGTKTIAEKNKLSLKILRKLKIKCPNKPSHYTKCPWVGYWEDLDKHLKDCEWKKIECPLYCGAIEAKCDMKEHKAKECPNRGINCPGCKKFIKITDMEKHKEYCFANPNVIILFLIVNGVLKPFPAQKSEDIDNLKNRIYENFCPKDKTPDEYIVKVEGKGETLNDEYTVADYYMLPSACLIVDFIYYTDPLEEEQPETVNDQQSSQEEILEELIDVSEFFY